MVDQIPVTLRSVVARCGKLLHLPDSPYGATAAQELADGLRGSYGAEVALLGDRQLASPQHALAAMTRHLAQSADVLILAVGSHIARNVRRDGDIWSVALPGSVPGRPASMLRFDKLAAAAARAANGRPLLLCLDAAEPSPRFAGDDTSAASLVDAILAAWPAHAGAKPGLLAARTGGETTAFHALERTLAAIAAAGCSMLLDTVIAQTAQFLADLGIDVHVSPSGTTGEVNPTRRADLLPTYIRDDLFAADPGSRLDAAAELALLAAIGDRQAESVLQRMASRDPAPQVRAYADILIRRHSQATPEALRSSGQIPVTVYDTARDGLFLPELLAQPAGLVPIGVDAPLGEPADRPRHLIELAPFRLSRTLITDRQYLAFLIDEHGLCPDHWSVETALWDEDTDRPVVMVSFHDASRYCEWLTNRMRIVGQLTMRERIVLPSEAEWEAAASNGRGDSHPWGNAPDPLRCNVRDTGIGHPSTVCAFSPRGDNDAGCADLVGNVWEWTRSVWGPSYRVAAYSYPYDPSDGREDLESHDGRRVVRGGAFYYATQCADSHTRNRMVPERRHPGGGFRVAATAFAS